MVTAQSCLYLFLSFLLRIGLVCLLKINLKWLFPPSIVWALWVFSHCAICLTRKKLKKLWLFFFRLLIVFLSKWEKNLRKTDSSHVYFLSTTIWLLSVFYGLFFLSNRLIVSDSDIYRYKFFLAKLCICFPVNNRHNYMHVSINTPTYGLFHRCRLKL